MMKIDFYLDKLGKIVAIKKTRVTRIYGYITIVNSIILLSIKFDGFNIIYSLIVLFIVFVIVGWFDKKYVHRHEIDYINSKNDFVALCKKEFTEIKQRLGNANETWEN